MPHPEHKHHIESDESVENGILPEDIAAQKLSQLNKMEDMGFAVRFMNIEEYKKLLLDESPHPPRELNGYCRPFKEWLNEHAQDWESSINLLTDWPDSLRGNEVRKELISILSSSQKKAETREVMIKNFHNRLMQSVAFEDRRSGPVNHELMTGEKFKYGILSHIFLEQKKGNLDPSNLDDLRAAYSGDSAKWQLNDDVIVAIHTFINSPENVSKKQLRMVVSEVSESRGHTAILGIRDMPYQVAVIFAPDAIEPRVSGNSLGELKKAEEHRYWIYGAAGAEKHILGAVVPFNDRALVQRVSELSMSSKSRANPVLDANGVVRFPVGQDVPHSMMNDVGTWLNAEEKKPLSEKVLAQYWGDVLELQTEEELAACSFMQQCTAENIRYVFHGESMLAQGNFQDNDKKLLIKSVNLTRFGVRDIPLDPCLQHKSDEEIYELVASVIKKFAAYYYKKHYPDSHESIDLTNSEYVNRVKKDLREWPNVKNAEGTITVGNADVPTSLIAQWDTEGNILQELQEEQPAYFNTLEKLRLFYMEKQRKDSMRKVCDADMDLLLLLESDPELLKKYDPAAAKFIDQK